LTTDHNTERRLKANIVLLHRSREVSGSVSTTWWSAEG
jgi:hypothetical protein